MLTLWYDIPFSIRKQKGQTRGFHVLLGLQLVRFGISFFFYGFCLREEKRSMQKETKLENKTQISLKCRLSVGDAQWGGFFLNFLKFLELLIG